MDDLRTALRTLENRLSRLQGRREALLRLREQVQQSTGLAKARKEQKASVDLLLDQLENRFHARSLGSLEQLMTAFLQDVLPHEQDTSVSLTLQSQRGMPALDIQLSHDGNLEDALHGRGGSVANILSTALRFIALARASAVPVKGFTFRPFLILDEADCWLRPDYVPAFSEVIYQLAQDLGMQILMISHHAADLLRGFPVHLERKGKRIEVRCLPLQNRSPNTLHGIRLRNFLSHTDTYIPLHPGVTVLTGDNDIGKSAIAEAFRAIAYNEGGDALIHHHQPDASVTVELGTGESIEWTRNRKSGPYPKVVYRLYDGDGQVLKETAPGRDVPDWVRQKLGIDRIGKDRKDLLDVQIHHQKTPVFLMDRSPSQRAAILDIGRESQYLRSVRERWKKQVEQDSRTINEGEKRIAAIESALRALNPLDALETAFPALEASVREMEARQEAAGKGVALCRDAIWLRKRLDRVSPESLDALKQKVEPLPDLSTLNRLDTDYRYLRSCERVQGAHGVWERYPVLSTDSVYMPTVKTGWLAESLRLYGEAHRTKARAALWEGYTQKTPVVAPLPDISALLHGLERYRVAARLYRQLRALDALPQLRGIQLPDLDGLAQWATRYLEQKQLQASMQQAKAEKDQLHREAFLVEQEQQAHLKAWGICPFCRSTITGGSHEHA